MDKIEKILRKIKRSDRERLGKVLKVLINKKFELLDVKKLKRVEFYRIRVGNFRIIFGFDKDKEVVIYRIQLRNERTYKI